jgi:hypothetical protein
MLVKQIPTSGILCFDDNLQVRNLRLNLVPKKGCRVKAEVSEDGKIFKEKDLSIYKYDTGLSIKGFHINVQGIELISNIQLNLRISYELSKKNWCITGKIGDHQVSKIGNIMEIMFSILSMI